MKHAIRNHELAHQPRDMRLNLVQAALIAGALTGIAAFATDGLRSVNIGYVDTRLDGPGAVRTVSVPKRTAIANDDGLSAEMARVRDWVASRYRVSGEMLEPVLVAAEDAGRRKGVDPLLIVAIMAVESSFNPRAVSNMGAQGLMQVMPRYHQDKIANRPGKDALFDPALNVRVGTQVLHEGLTRYGSVQNALQYYNGSLGDPSLRYARKVMALKKQLVAAAAGETPSAG